MLDNTFALASSAGVDTARTPPKVPTGQCVVCGEPFPMHPRGWARRYCGSDCKDVAWRRSHVEAERAKGRKWWAAHSGERNAKRRTPEYRLRQRIRRAQRLAEAENQVRDRRAKLAKLFKGSEGNVGV